jgi:hypothetical protein
MAAADGEPLPDGRQVATGTGDRLAAIAEAAEAVHEAVFDLDVVLHIVARSASPAPRATFAASCCCHRTGDGSSPWWPITPIRR